MKEKSLLCLKKGLSKQDLKDMLKQAISEPNGVKKGNQFETFFQNLVYQEPEFTLIRPHCRSDVGEIDFLYRVDCRGHPLWSKCQYLFVECKNWKEIISSEKADHYISLFEKKNLFSNCCGVYITTSSFSPQAITAVKDAIKNKKLTIILIDRTELISLIEKGFKIFLQEKFDELLSKI